MNNVKKDDGLYWDVLGSTGVLDLTRLHWNLIGWSSHWSGGSGGPVIQVVQLVQVVQVARMISIDDMPSENIWFYGLNHQIMEKSSESVLLDQKPQQFIF